jgi:ribosomal-protein-alanine N-acetyltransferase
LPDGGAQVKSRVGDATVRSHTTELVTIVTRLEREAEDIAAVEAMSRESFDGTGLALAEELARPWSRIWVAREGTASRTPRSPEPIGFLLAWHVADELHILNVATSANMRRRGVATALLGCGLDYARTNAIRIVLLEVRRSNRPAIKLYRKHAFTALGVRPGYYADNGEDAIEMILGLDPATGAIVPSRDEIRIDG